MSGVGDEPGTLIDLLELRCSTKTDRVVYGFLDNAVEAGRLTVGELWRRTRQMAASLRASRAPGDRVLLLFPTGLEFIVALFACVAAGLIAVPAPPPDPTRRKRTLPRLLSMVRDAEPSLVLADARLVTGLEGLLAEVSELAALPWRTLDDLIGDGISARDWRRPEIDGDSVAYLQYTSGSTADPKGVMVTHGNLLHNSRAIREAWRYDSASVAVHWVPNFHDDGLVHGILQPLFCGGRAYFMEPMAFVGRPARWLDAISHYRATHGGGPDFAYVLAARKVTEEQRAGLDLTTWRLAYNAAEPIRRDSLEAFARVFEPCGFDPRAFFPSFGLAETTLLVTTARWGSSPVYLDIDTEALEHRNRVAEVGKRGSTLVGCGSPVLDTEVVIVRPATCERAAADEVGEIWVHGDSVAGGYWRREEETERIFGARLREDLDDRRYLRTGDLGFLSGGELFITGRSKDLIIIRGRNVYPQDLEGTVAASHPALRPGCGAAFGIERLGEERLVVVQEAGDRAPLAIDTIAENVRRRLAQEHDVELEELVLIRPRTIPKTSSGKIQRHVCRREFLADELEPLASWRRPQPPQERPTAAGDADDRPVSEPAEPAPDGLMAELSEWLRSFAERVDWRRIDERRSFPPHLVLELGERGFLGLQVPTSQGGLGLSNRDFVSVLKQLGAIDLTLATLIAGHNALGLRPIQRHAGPELRRQLVPSLARGRELAAFALTEPGAGSNPRAIEATAVPEGEGWRLYGTKLWSGSAGGAGVINIFVQLLDGQGLPRGIAGFAVRPDAEGLRIGEEALTMGLRGMTQNAIHLEGVPVSASRLLGKADDGMAVAEDAMLFTRLCLAAICVGGTQRCAQLMLRYASRRKIATGRLLDNPVARVRFTDLLCEVAAVEALVTATARSLDGGESVPQEVFAALKIAGPEMLWRTADRMVQMLGARGYIENNMAPRILRDARVFRIFEGPTEAIQMWLGASLDRDDRRLDRFLRRRLAAGEVADRMRPATRRVRTRFSQAPGSLPDRVAARRWMHSLIGEHATAAILWAAAQATDGGTDAERAAEWARRRFESATARTSAESPGEAVLYGAEEARRAIAAFATDIGDWEPLAQATAAQGNELDPLLTRARSAPEQDRPRGFTVPRSTAGGPVGAGEAGEVGTAAIEEWLVDWCCREIGIESGEVDVELPFTSLGLNSVTAVALADQLGSWLQRPLQRTLVWQYPSIAAVSRHLSGNGPAAAARPASETPTDPGEAEVRHLLDGVERLSDAEADAALAREQRAKRL